MSGREKPCLILPQKNLGSSCPFALSHLKFNIDLSSSMKKPLLDLVILCRRINILTMSSLTSEHSVYEQGTCMHAASFQSCPTVCDPMDARLLWPWDSPGKSTGVGCRALLQGIFPTQGSNQVSWVSCIGRWILYHQCHLNSVQSLGHVQLFATLWTAAHQASLSITNSQSLFKLMSLASVMPSSHLILCHSLLPPSIFPSFRVFSNESVLHIRWPKYWSFSFSISPSDEYSGLISLGLIGWISLQSKGLSRVFNTTVQKHQFFDTQLSL